MSQKKKKRYIYIYTGTCILVCINQTLCSGGIDKSSPTQDIHWSTYFNQPWGTETRTVY